jgi:hypothetical protein
VILQMTASSAKLCKSEVLFMRSLHRNFHFSFEGPSRITHGIVLERIIDLINEERYGDADALEREFVELADYE